MLSGLRLIITKSSCNLSCLPSSTCQSFVVTSCLLSLRICSSPWSEDNGLSCWMEVFAMANAVWDGFSYHLVVMPVISSLSEPSGSNWMCSSIHVLTDQSSEQVILSNTCFHLILAILQLSLPPALLAPPPGWACSSCILLYCNEELKWYSGRCNWSNLHFVLHPWVCQLNCAHCSPLSVGLHSNVTVNSSGHWTSCTAASFCNGSHEPVWQEWQFVVMPIPTNVAKATRVLYQTLEIVAYLFLEPLECKK